MGQQFDYSPMYQGISNLGHGIASAMQQFEEMKKEQERADAQMQALSTTPNPLDPTGQKPLIDEKTMTAYNALSGQKKASFAGAKMGALAMFAQFQKNADEHRIANANVEQLLAHGKYYTARADPTNELGNFTPRVVTINPPGGKPFNVWQRTPQQFERVYEPAEIQYDEQTGMPYTLGPKGEMKALKPEDIATSKALFRQQPSPTPAPGGASVFKPWTWFGSAPSATPAPAAAAAPVYPRAIPVEPQGAPVAATGKVHVQHPDGSTGWIPATQLQAATAAGYKQIP